MQGCYQWGLGLKTTKAARVSERVMSVLPYSLYMTVKHIRGAMVHIFFHHRDPSSSSNVIKRTETWRLWYRFPPPPGPGVHIQPAAFKVFPMWKKTQEHMRTGSRSVERRWGGGGGGEEEKEGGGERSVTFDLIQHTSAGPPSNTPRRCGARIGRRRRPIKCWVISVSTWL